MLAVSHRNISALPTLHHGVDMEDSGTINPAALNAPGKHWPHRTVVRRVVYSDDSADPRPAGLFNIVAYADPSAPPVESTIAPNLLSTSSPRGIKRSRSPDSYGATGQEGEGGTFISITHINLSSSLAGHPAGHSGGLKQSTPCR